MHHNTLKIGDGNLDFEQVKDFFYKRPSLALSADAEIRIARCRQYLDEKMKNPGELFYGINTGVGFLQDVAISRSQLEELQSNLLKSHACGMGEEVPADIVRLMMMLKIKSLAFGNSGVSVELVRRLTEMYNHDVLPVIYTQGSLGASGDLAPLSHLCLPLIGLGEVFFRGQRLTAMEALKELDWQPIELQSKEGLALINGTQFMGAYGLCSLIHSQRLIDWADIIAAISFEGFDGVADCFNEKIHAVRAH